MSGWEWGIWTDKKIYRSRNGKYGPIKINIDPKTRLPTHTTSQTAIIMYNYLNIIISTFDDLMIKH
ncbi:hypothetical protein BUZ94_05070 [Mammaliicoccus sciuri]|nr:hypothetical protein B5728_00495 [Mammaliicoccus sciuri]RIN88466.1 hypothetical protein BU011_06130 [Mammaliicoccus sciuri]RIN92018.1 hypothetical protein BU003_03450 [Mammaliicoccus sciuri]RIN96874.1 hypothetical protein BU002_03155 [Mammaliicoccus sciuri]RIO10443.1 hypothetical protein BUZ94_05070 [Mammaliicoccus sciuri]